VFGGEVWLYECGNMEPHRRNGLKSWVMVQEGLEETLIGKEKRTLDGHKKMMVLSLTFPCESSEVDAREAGLGEGIGTP